MPAKTNKNKPQKSLSYSLQANDERKNTIIKIQ